MLRTSCVVLLPFLVASVLAQGSPCREGWHFHAGKCYDVSASAVPWIDAEEYCKLANALLAEIETAEENAYVKNLVITNGINEAWLGGTDIYEEGNWIWISSGGNIYPFTDWADGQPNDGGTGEDCLAYKKAVNYQWADAICTEDRYFVCEAEPVDTSVVG